MKTIKSFVAILLTTVCTMAYADPVTLLDYTFPGKSSSHSNYVTSLPASQTQDGFTIGFESLNLRNTCVRMDQVASKVTVTYAADFQAGDVITLNWTSKTPGNKPTLSAEGATDVYADPTEETGDQPLQHIFTVGSAEGQFNIAGKKTFTITRYSTDNSIELRSLVITGEARELPEEPEEPEDPETPTQLVVNSAMTWDWTKASAGDTKVSPASATDTVLMSTITGITENYSQFDARYIKLCGENAVRNNDACQVNWLMLKLEKPGHVKVTFCSVGDSNKGQRYLFINGVTTGIYSENVEATDPKVVEKDVPAGNLEFTAQRTDKTGNQAFRIMRIEFTPTPTTALEETEQQAKANSQKQIKNGQLLIERDGQTYNVMGMEVR